jgi:hypothetical protein
MKIIRILKTTLRNHAKTPGGISVKVVLRTLLTKMWNMYRTETFISDRLLRYLVEVQLPDSRKNVSIL